MGIKITWLYLPDLKADDKVIMERTKEFFPPVSYQKIKCSCPVTLLDMQFLKTNSLQSNPLNFLFTNKSSHWSYQSKLDRFSHHSSPEG